MSGVSEKTFGGTKKSRQKMDPRFCKEGIGLQKHSAESRQIFPILAFRHCRKQAAGLRRPEAKAKRIYGANQLGSFFSTTSFHIFPLSNNKTELTHKT